MPTAVSDRLDTKVRLSSIRPEDSPTLFRWINDPETVRFNAAYKPVHWASHEEWCRSLAANPGKQVLAIRVGDRLVGVVQLIDIDPVHRSAELTIRIGEDADRGCGYGTQARCGWRPISPGATSTCIASGCACSPTTRAPSPPTGKRASSTRERCVKPPISTVAMSTCACSGCCGRVR
jgi:hypothetical protein